MATRRSTIVLKNSVIPNQALPSSGILLGEPLINLGDGIMFFTGGTSGSPTWIPSSPTSGYFEVGSNLYDLKLRNRIIMYEGLSGSNLTGKFLSGTTSGFTLANISSIVGVDTYPTGFTYNNNVFTIAQNVSGPTLTALFNTVTGLTVSGTLSATTLDGATIQSGGTDLYTAFLTPLDTRFVNVTGDTMTGGLNVNGTISSTTINALTVQSGGTDLAIALGNSFDARYVNTSGDTMTGGLNVNGTISSTTINALTVQSGGTDLATALVVPFDVRYVNTAGDTMTGTLYGTTISATTLDGATVNSGGTDLAIALGNSFDSRFVNTSGDTMTGGLNVNGTISSTTINALTVQSGGTDLATALVIPFDVRYVNTSGDTMTGGLNVIGTISSTTINALTVQSGGTDLATALVVPFDVRYVNVTGDTMTGSLNVSGNTTLTDLYLDGRLKSYGGATNVNGKFLSGTTDGFQLADISTIVGVDTYVTGFTYTDATNTFTISQSAGGPTKTALINQMSGLTIGSGGSPSTPGTGDLIVHGDLTVFGAAISAFTSELYVEDNNIYLNYNPTGSTTSTSIGAGWSIQDGSGTSGSPVNMNINRLDTLTGLTAGNVPNVDEYAVGGIGYANRGWITQLNDIILRSTNVSTPNGVRVLTEFDVLDGGTF